MPFFIRKKEGSGNNRLSNTDAKKRVVRPNKFGSQKRKFQKTFNNNNNDSRHNNGSMVIPGKKPKFDEEISSGSEESDTEDKNDQILLDEEDVETAQEKKLRLAKLYLEEIEKEERQRTEDAQVDEEAVSKRLQEDVLEAEGRLKRDVADGLEAPTVDQVKVLRCCKHLTRPVTCLAISPDEQFIFSACKFGHLYKWSVSDGKKVNFVKRLERLTRKKKKKAAAANNKKGVEPVTNSSSSNNNNSNSSHSTTITCMAISSDGKFLATGDMENKIVIWNPDTLQRIHIFKGHRKPIRGLVFRRKTHTLYSSSDDRTVRIWSLDDMAYVETLFGHQDSVTSIDALNRERAISSGGRDGTIRVWKIVEESQLVYNGNPNGNIDSVKLINEENFISASDDGSISLWNVNRKKPLVTIEQAHGMDGEHPRWISAISSYTNTDLVASGSSDGVVRVWKCGDKFKSLTQVFTVPCPRLGHDKEGKERDPGWINCIEFSKNGKFLVIGVGKEHRLGRWFENKSAVNSLFVIPLVKRDGDSE